MKITTRLNTVIQSIRLPFLLLTLVCVLLAISLVINTKQPLNFLFVTLALAGALLAHISVNTLNEYHDFTSGLDLVTTRTKFSGGSGALPSQPDSANLVLILGLVSLVATLAIGVFFVLEYGLAIMPIGIFGLLLIVTYTRWVNKHPLICLIAPGTGFGILMVVGSQFALTGEYLRLSWFIAAIPFCLVNNLLLLNQYPILMPIKLLVATISLSPMASTAVLPFMDYFR